MITNLHGSQRNMQMQAAPRPRIDSKERPRLLHTSASVFPSYQRLTLEHLA
jgi:hypothetical protein